MAEKGGITKKEARRGVDLFFETLIDCMREDEKVVFTGLGKFEMKTFKERKGRIPIGGAECIVPEHRKMKFYASEKLQDRIKGVQGRRVNIYGVNGWQDAKLRRM